MKRRYSMRNLRETPGLPESTWLDDHPDVFRKNPGQFPPNCTWCGRRLAVLRRRWRMCSKCDTPQKED